MNVLIRKYQVKCLILIVNIEQINNLCVIPENYITLLAVHELHYRITDKLTRLNTNGYYWLSSAALQVLHSQHLSVQPKQRNPCLLIEEIVVDRKPVQHTQSIGNRTPDSNVHNQIYHNWSRLNVMAQDHVGLVAALAKKMRLSEIIIIKEYNCVTNTFRRSRFPVLA